MDTGLQKSQVVAKPHSRFTSGPALVLYLAAAKLLLHLLPVARYGIFRDEMYYLACSRHMAWGYVDHPPLTVWVAWLSRNVLGDSPLGVRLLPILAGAALVWLTGRLAREMGGGRFAQAMAALAVVVVPIYLVGHSWLTDNVFEHLIWIPLLARKRLPAKKDCPRRHQNRTRDLLPHYRKHLKRTFVHFG